VTGAGRGQRRLAITQLAGDRTLGRHAGIALGFGTHRTGGDHPWRIDSDSLASHSANASSGPKLMIADSGGSSGMASGKSPCTPLHLGLAGLVGVDSRDHRFATCQQTRQQEVTDLTASPNQYQFLRPS
jgi:hypothetical protein